MNTESKGFFKEPRINELPKTNYNNQKVIQTSNNNPKNPVISENQKSPTFRSVGPNLDSTINYQGQKYSNIIQNMPSKRISPGYYGRSRLTRI